jgi:hypothetical protein
MKGGGSISSNSQAKAADWLALSFEYEGEQQLKNCSI